MPKHWTPDDLLNLIRAYQPACVLAAAAELDIFTVLQSGPLSARATAERLRADVRGVEILLDALAALELLSKNNGQYAVPPGVADAMTDGGASAGGDGPARPGSVLAMVLHQANCLRRWAQLARVVRDGKHTIPTGSIRGDAGDQQSFIDAMHVVSRDTAPVLVTELGPPPFRHLLDIGGASGTWSIAFLNLMPGAKATLFDLPEVIPMARERLTREGMIDRFTLAAGDFNRDELPAGADLAWLGAIVHQNSRAENRALYGRIFRALAPGGRLLIRDFVMDEDRTTPPGGALFAVNMLVGTAAGGTFTLTEYCEDLERAGFHDVTAVVRDDTMNSVVQAKKP